MLALKCAPIDPLKHFGPQTSQLSLEIKMSLKLNAIAERIILPKLPGSCIPNNTKTLFIFFKSLNLFDKFGFSAIPIYLPSL